jgi:uncharacterized Fe-S cluster-containing MiaB family protein
MKLLQRNIFLIVLIVCCIGVKPMLSQNFTETPEHKRMWQKFGRKKHREAFNPNVKNDKATHEISKKQAKQDKKDLKKSNKEAMKQYRKNKRKVKTGK